MKTALILGIFAIGFVCAEPEANPEAEADPYLLYGSYYGLVGKNLHGYVHPTHGYALGTYPAYTYLAYGRKKREAESDAEPKADADPYLLYGGYYGSGLSYASSYYSYPRYTYSYPAYSYGLWGRKKREAEAEPKADADPYLLYGGYGAGLYGGYASSYYSYPSYTYSYPAYGYSIYGRKKREAEAEPKADADPYLLYGGYYGSGLRYPYFASSYYRYPAYGYAYYH